MEEVITDQPVVTITMPQAEVVNEVVNEELPVVNEQTSTQVTTDEAKVFTPEMEGFCIPCSRTFLDIETHRNAEHKPKHPSFGEGIPLAVAPVIQRDEKGRITSGIAQETNKNGTAGRPCEYCNNAVFIDQKIKKYLDDCRGGSGKLAIPYLQEIADMLDVDKETIMDWSNKLNAETKELEHPEFNRLTKRLVNLQELRLNQKLMGRYNPTGAIFLLKTKHKYIETEKQILAGETNEPLEIIITEQK